ncbi:MAG: phosphate ABC transporter permease [Oscillatoriales cyanobacterium C42_A2020_001]|nr:phosphate ABC transporter permease [Leptolyngbyaceae cyanobacterium C42_A2020_001]
MLIPLTRKTFEELVPAVATGAQYAHCWGKLSELLRRVLISVVGMFVVILLKALFFREGFDEFLLVGGIVVGLYWLWGPVLTASLQNIECRRYGYCGFWQGKVLDVYISEELIGTEETVNNRGDLVIVENRERCLNLEVGDELGFLTCLRVPLKRSHRAIDIGDTAELLVFSNRADLGRISKTSDIYLSDHNLWVSDYPFVRRDAFVEVSRRINRQLEVEPAAEPERPKRKRTPKSQRRGELVQPERSSSRDRYEEDGQDSYRGADLPRRRSSRRRSANNW